LNGQNGGTTSSEGTVSFNHRSLCPSVRACHTQRRCRAHRFSRSPDVSKAWIMCRSPRDGLESRDETRDGRGLGDPHCTQSSHPEIAPRHGASERSRQKSIHIATRIYTVQAKGVVSSSSTRQDHRRQRRQHRQAVQSYHHENNHAPRNAFPVRLSHRFVIPSP
jgi:hypothetical protein